MVDFPDRDDISGWLTALENLVEPTAAPTEAGLQLLRAALGDTRKRIQRRAAEVCATLASRGWPIPGLLGDALADPVLSLRWGATYAWSLIGTVPASAQATLIELLGDADGDLRWAAGALLKRLAERDRASVVADLIASVRQVPNARKMALYCLRDLGAGEAIAPALSVLAADDELETRLAALATVAALEADHAIAARRIAALVEDADPRMQRAAAGTLGSLGVGSPEVLSALRRALASDDASLQRAAARSLERLAPKR
jgi:HEAT repeat protein